MNQLEEPLLLIALVASADNQQHGVVLCGPGVLRRGGSQLPRGGSDLAGGQLQLAGHRQHTLGVRVPRVPPRTALQGKLAPPPHTHTHTHTPPPSLCLLIPPPLLVFLGLCSPRKVILFPCRGNPLSLSQHRNPTGATQVLGAAAVRKLHVFKAQELSNLLLAYAKTDNYDWATLSAIDEAQSKLSYLDASCQVGSS